MYCMHVYICSVRCGLTREKAAASFSRKKIIGREEGGREKADRVVAGSDTSEESRGPFQMTGGGVSLSKLVTILFVVVHVCVADASPRLSASVMEEYTRGG